MIPVSKVVKKYPNIAYFFPDDLLKSELKKCSEDIHPLAKQLTFKDNDDSSLVYLEYVERCLNELKNEIKGHETHFKGLVHKERYHGILAELEIGLMCKNMGFEFEFEPPVQNGFSDIKITNAETEIFIEVPIRKGLSFNEKEKIGDNCTIMEFETRPPQKFKGKIIKESSQLSKIRPSIFVLVIEPSSISEIESIKRGFGFSCLWGKYIQLGIDPSKIVKERVSGLLIYCNYITKNEENNCRYIKEDTFLCVNPMANFPLPTSVIQKFEIYGAEIIQPSIYQL
ncbi:hypothetical protein MSSIT_2798 [Methanosarcina siciliae T4/M]|uniref:Uncharacterized protein n=1 Tax=Methanosarcina siciliae T4/M TaxID=1434120 RepID=A0A0E3P6X1_9EURY|nr:hypothetical protein [Methanosarcina siciliae]AKB29517.1 hypothetical protein MSSIT_2798 [Methanosarcina siciliae T4/M]